MNKQWKQALLSLAGVTSDEVTKKEEKRPNYRYENGKESPLQGEFTGNMFPGGGDPVKKEISNWKAMNQAFQTLRGKGEPKPGLKKQKDFGSPLNDPKQTGRAEQYQTREDVLTGAGEPKYKTGARKSQPFRIGAKFGALKTKSIVTISSVGVWSKFKGKVASGDITYLDPTNAKQPESDNMVVVAYRHSTDGKTYAAKVSDFFAAFVPMEKRAHSLDEAAQAMIKSDLQQISRNFQQYLAYDEPQYLEKAKLLCEQLGAQFGEATAKHDQNSNFQEMSVGSSQRIAKAPPHSEYTVHELKKNKEIDNPFALAWDMKNKGKKLHDKKPKKSAWKSFFQRIADAVATPNKGSDKWPPSPDKGAKDSWTNQILGEAKSIPDGEYWWMHGDRPMLLNDTDIRRTTKESVIQQYYRTGFKELPPDVQVKISAAATRQYKKRSYKEAFEGAAPPFGSPEREEWSSGKKKDEEPESTPDKDDKTTKEANQYFHCPNCGHQGDVSDFPLNEPDMGRMTQRCPQCGKSFDVDEGDMVNTDKSKGQPADSYDDFGINRNYRGANRTNSGKQAAVDFTQKPDGTINIAVEGLPDVPASPQDMGAMEAPVTGTGNGTGAAATPATPPDTGNTPPAKGGKSSNMVGRKVVDSVLGNGTVTAVRGNQVIASFADGNYTTSAANIL